MPLKLVLTLLLAIPLLTGCGSGEKPATIVKVSGTVILDGSPVPNAEVKVIPTKGPPSSAITDEKGEFKLTCSDGREGVVPGTNEVMVTTKAPNPKAPQMRAGREETPPPAMINTVYRYVEPIAMNEATTSLSLDLSKAAKMQR